MGDKLQAEWSAMIAAPFLFWGSVIVAGLAIWAIIHFLYRNRIDGLKEELDRERRENERLKSIPAPPVAPANVLAKKATASPQKESSALTHLPRFEVAQAEVPEQDRVFLGPNVTGSFLRAFFKDRTQHQGQQAVQLYIGKWMRVEGAVRNIVSNRQNWTVLIFNKGPGDVVGSAHITCLASETPKLEILQKGDVIKAEGRLTKVEERWIYLDQAHLL